MARGPGRPAQAMRKMWKQLKAARAEHEQRRDAERQARADLKARTKREIRVVGHAEQDKIDAERRKANVPVPLGAIYDRPTDTCGNQAPKN